MSKRKLCLVLGVQSFINQEITYWKKQILILFKYEAGNVGLTILTYYNAAFKI